MRNYRPRTLPVSILMILEMHHLTSYASSICSLPCAMPDPVESFTISVLASQGQSDCISAVASSFLETFPHLAWDISAVGTNDIEVPSVDLSLVLPWFQQNRLGYVNGACDLDLRLAPSLPASCGRRAIDRFSLWLGRRYPYAALHASDATSVPTYRAPPPAEAAWAYACQVLYARRP